MMRLTISLLTVISSAFLPSTLTTKNYIMPIRSPIVGYTFPHKKEILMQFKKNDDDKDDPDDIEDSGFLDSFKNNRKKNIEKLGWNTTENDKDDLVEKFAQLMGFESYEKWKAVRFTIYALVAGYLLADLKDEIVANLNNPFSNL